MTDIKEVWDFQRSIAFYHKYTMIVNSVIPFLCLVRYPSSYFNLYKISNTPSYTLSLAYLSMPLYYLLESYTTLNFCKAYLHYTCKFIIHHVLTISLTITVFQYNYFNFFTLITPAVHGFMNIGYYYNEGVEYIMCRWYAAFTVIDLLFFVVVFLKAKEERKASAQLILIGIALGINNLNTPELVEMCVLKDTVKLWVPEEILHVIGLCFFCVIIFYYTKKPHSKISV